MRPPVRFATTVDGGRVAYTVAGGGYPFIDVTGGWMHNLALEWDTPGVLDFYFAMATHFKFILVEPRGGPNSGVPPEGRSYRDYVLDDIDAVMETLRIQQCAMAASDYCVQELCEYATSRPGAVTHLVLINPQTDTEIADVDWAEYARAQALDASVLGEDEYLFKARSLIARGASQEHLAAIAALWRAADTPRGELLGSLLNERNRAFDLKPFLGVIAQPTLVAAGSETRKVCSNRGGDSRLHPGASAR